MYYDLSIQIVNYNTKSYLLKCLEDIIKDLKNSNITYQIMILDNDSNDDLSHLEHIYQDVVLKVYKSEINLGFGGGHNFLFQKAQAPVILILNPDIELYKDDTIKTLYVFFTQNARIAVLGPKLISKNNITVEYDHGELKGLKSWYRNNLGESYWIDRMNLAKVAWVSGAFLLTRTEIIRRVQGFDENFFMYKEEEDLCLRIRKLGYKIYYYPLIKVFHHTEVSTSKSVYIDDSNKYYIKKNLKGKFLYKVLIALRYLRTQLRLNMICN